VGPEGVVYAVEFSATIARSLIRLAASRSNIVPIIEDARHPARYAPLISSQVDVAYQDIAQPDQARILHDNVAAFCSYGSWAMIAIKARSIDSTSDVTQVYSREISKLDALGLEVIERIDLEPFDRDHVFAVCRVREDMK
jgi:rRNA 2'-O-methyltransferase fibrillarin